MEKLHKFVSIFEIVFFILMTYFFIAIPGTFRGYMVFMFLPLFYILWKFLSKKTRRVRWIVFIVSMIIYWLTYYYIAFNSAFLKEDSINISSIFQIIIFIVPCMVFPIGLFELLKRFLLSFNSKKIFNTIKLAIFGIFTLLYTFIIFLVMCTLWFVIVPDNWFKYVGIFIISFICILFMYFQNFNDNSNKDLKPKNKLHKFVSIFEIVFFILMTYFFIAIPGTFRGYMVFMFLPLFYILWKFLSKKTRRVKWIVFIVSMIIYWAIYYYVIFIAGYIQHVDEYSIEYFGFTIIYIVMMLVIPIGLLECLKKIILNASEKIGKKVFAALFGLFVFVYSCLSIMAASAGIVLYFGL